tara:strand:- start:144 stop:374 length:231 start_codon:yes stop_codon:yes gene_type:complete
MHDRITKIKKIFIMAQGWGPNAAGTRDTLEIEQTFFVQRMRDEVPMYKITRMMNLDTGKPFEGRCGDVKVITNPTD